MIVEKSNDRLHPTLLYHSYFTRTTNYLDITIYHRHERIKGNTTTDQRRVSAHYKVPSVSTYKAAELGCLRVSA